MTHTFGDILADALKAKPMIDATKPLQLVYDGTQREGKPTPHPVELLAILHKGIIVEHKLNASKMSISLYAKDTGKSITGSPAWRLENVPPPKRKVTKYIFLVEFIDGTIDTQTWGNYQRAQGHYGDAHATVLGCQLVTVTEGDTFSA